ncbi:MAG: PAS domain S-box protein, partial [Thiogranum sp.]
FPVEVRLRRFPNGAGLHGAMVLAVVRDISALHFETTALKREQDLSSAVLDTIGSVVVVLNRSGRIVSFNQAAQSISGYSAEEAVGRRVWDFLLADNEREGVEDVFARLAAGDFPCSYENSWLARDGKSHRIVWNNSALVDNEGRVEYVIATGIDITEQRRAERDLARVETEWNKAIEFFADPIFLVGLDDRVIRANHAFFSMIGKPASQVIGHDISAIMYPDGEAVPCHVCAARRERKDVDIVLEEDHPDNPVGRPIEVTLRVIRDAYRKPVGILMGIRDLSRQRQIEAELRQHRDHLEELVQQRTSALESVNRELESFSYSVSHDLRAPLRSIDGFSHALLEDYNAVLDETGLGYLHRVRKASQRMGQLIDDLLQLSRVGRDAMECRQIDLSKLAGSVVRLLREGDSEREMDVYIQDDMKTFGDPRLLRLLLENLLGNAWKFSSPRTVGEISFGVTNQDGRQEFYVRDNGIGFDMKYADKLFGPFQRLHSDTDFAGTGIGLATVYRIVKRHEGDIRAASEPDQGATFYFSFGLRAGEPTSEA